MESFNHARCRCRLPRTTITMFYGKMVMDKLCSARLQVSSEYWNFDIWALDVVFTPNMNVIYLMCNRTMNNEHFPIKIAFRFFVTKYAEPISMVLSWNLKPFLASIENDKQTWFSFVGNLAVVHLSRTNENTKTYGMSFLAFDFRLMSCARFPSDLCICLEILSVRNFEIVHYYVPFIKRVATINTQ